MFASLYLAMALFADSCDAKWNAETDGWYECKCAATCDYPDGCW